MLAVKTLRSNLNIFRRSIWLMGNQFEISLVANDPMWAEAQITDAVSEINRVDKLLSALGDNSKVNEINRNAGIKPVKVDPEIFRLIDRSLQISALTYGAFDITYVTADQAEVKPSAFVNTYSNYQNVVLDPQAVTVFLKEKNMRISFASIGKGYAADRAKYVLQMQGVSSGVINAGGDLLTWGTQPNSADWTIGTADPELQTQPFANLNIGNMCIATSINAERAEAINTKPYANMVNAKKGFPVSEITRVSVISPTAELSDAMATPIMNMGVNAGLYLINQLNQISCLIIDDHNRIYTSNGIERAD
jgi:thiamine biosynthesis lipoprotein